MVGTSSTWHCSLVSLLLAAEFYDVVCFQQTNYIMPGDPFVSSSMDAVALSLQSDTGGTDQAASHIWSRKSNTGVRSMLNEQLLLARSGSGVHGMRLLLAACLVMSTLLFCGAVAAYYVSVVRLPSQGKLRKNCKNSGAQSDRSSELDSTESNTRHDTHCDPSLPKVIFFVCGLTVCGSFLVVVNKWALSEFRPPHSLIHTDAHSTGYLWTLVAIQFSSAAAAARFAGVLGFTQCESFSLRKATAFFPASSLFMITIVSGNAVLNNSNINTFLVLRCLAVVPCSLLELIIYQEFCPPCGSWFAMLITIGGAFGYSITTGGVQLNSMAWATIFLVTMPVDGVLIKHSISSSGLSSWGLVYYNNILAALPALAFALLFEITSWDNFYKICAAACTPSAVVAISVSCLLGIATSFFQLNTRFYISATAFMLLGVVNKFITVLVNAIFMENEGFVAIFFITLALLGAIGWQQTMKGDTVKVRRGSSSWEKNVVFPFILSCIGLAWVAYTAYSQIPSDSPQGIRV